MEDGSPETSLAQAMSIVGRSGQEISDHEERQTQLDFVRCKMLHYSPCVLGEINKRDLCGPQAKFVPDAVLEHCINDAICAFDRPGQRTVGRKASSHVRGSRRNEKLLSESEILLSSELDKESERTQLLAWIIECGIEGGQQAAAHEDTWKSKVAHYLEYGSALTQTNKWRGNMLNDLEEKFRQTPKLRDAVGEALTLTTLPPVVAFQEICTVQQLPPALVNGTSLEVPAYFPRTNTIDTITRFLLQGVGNVFLATSEPTRAISDVAREYASSTSSVEKRQVERHPGYVVDISRATALLASSIRNGIFNNHRIWHQADFRRTTASLTALNFLPSFAPNVSSVKHFDMSINLPMFTRTFYPSQMYLMQDGLSTLRSTMPNLVSLRVTVIESDKDRNPMIARGSYLARGFSQSSTTTMEAELHKLINRFRQLDLHERTLVYVNEDCKPEEEQEAWAEGVSGLYLEVVDGTALEDGEMAKRAMEMQQIEHLI